MPLRCLCVRHRGDSMSLSLSDLHMMDVAVMVPYHDIYTLK